MKCPNCGHEQMDGWLSCQKCHIIFSRWVQGQGAEVHLKPTAPTEYSTSAFKRVIEPKPKKKSSLLNALIILILMVFSASTIWWLFNFKGLAVPADAFRDEENGFAFIPPPDWESVTKDRDIMERFGGIFPPNIRDLLQTRDTVIGFVKVMRPLILSPSVNVIVSRDDAFGIDEQARAAASEAISLTMRSFMKEYRQERLDVIDIDRLKVLRIVFTGIVNFNNTGSDASSVAFLKHQMRFQQIFIPRSDGSFILTFSATSELYEDLQEEFNQVENSFRVLDRPMRFKPAIQYGTTAILGLLLLFLVSVFFKTLARR